MGEKVTGDWYVYSEGEITEGNIVRGDRISGNNNNGVYNITQTGTKRVTERRQVATLYYFPIYETSTYSTSYVTTYVISTTEEDGHQSNAELRETTSTTDVVERKAVGSILIREISYEQRSRTDTMERSGTATYKKNNMSGDPDWTTDWTVDSEGTAGSITQVNGEKEYISEETTALHPNFDAASTETVERPETTVYKSISREFISVDMTIKQVSYTPANDDGTYGETTVYTEESPFLIMETAPNANGNYEQKYYVSQCFLKSYPMSVNMTFEQRSKND